MRDPCILHPVTLILTSTALHSIPVLLGVPMVTVGFRTRTGILSAVQDFPTLSIPGLCASSFSGYCSLVRPQTDSRLWLDDIIECATRLTAGRLSTVYRPATPFSLSCTLPSPPLPLLLQRTHSTSPLRAARLRSHQCGPIRSEEQSEAPR